MKTAVITGGSRGLGAATVERLAKDGYNTAIIYNNDKEAAGNLLATISNNTNTNPIMVKADVGSEKSVKNVVQEIKNHFGTIDVLVNNAGIVYDIPFEERTTKQWQRTMDVNLNGVFYCTKLFKPIINQGGSIVNISSTNGLYAFHPDTVDYDVSKAGVIMFTKAMARLLAPDIRINCIAPGWFDTAMNTGLSEEYRQKESEKISMGRFGRAEELANVISFLVSDDASFMTGSTLVVDGGYEGAV